MLHRGLDSRAFGTTSEETVVPPWHHRDPWSSLAESWSMYVAATRNVDSMLATTPEDAVPPPWRHRDYSTSIASGR
jgi:hypothetical protein